MTNSPKKFVVAKKDIIAPGGVAVEKDDVGVIKSEAKNHTSVFFIENKSKV